MAAQLATEVARYLAFVDELTLAGVTLEWRSEADELGALDPDDAPAYRISANEWGILTGGQP